jgi:hypothetical protein|tara:strand:+ start:38589 stop:38888 length:300 start_codon:yes stop_codon:yes gene_type:complete
MPTIDIIGYLAENSQDFGLPDPKIKPDSFLSAALSIAVDLDSVGVKCFILKHVPHNQIEWSVYLRGHRHEVWDAMVNDALSSALVDRAISRINEGAGSE